LFAAARQFDRPAQFEHRSRLARQIAMSRFTRPWSLARFHDSVALAERHIAGGE